MAFTLSTHTTQATQRYIAWQQQWHSSGSGSS
jgi:hypothetical protein